MGKAALTGALLCALLAGGASAALPRPRSSVLIVLNSPRAKPAAERAMRSLPAGTPASVRVLRSALCSARSLAASAQSTVILVASGGYSCAQPPSCDLVSAGSHPPPVRVDAIGVGVRAATRRNLGCIARSNGGVYRDAATPAALEPELRAALGRATRDRRSLGRPVAGGLEIHQATGAGPGEYVDTIAPGTERWYSVTFPQSGSISVAATLVAPSTGDVAAPGSTLALQAGTASTVQSNLFAFSPDRFVTVQTKLSGLGPHPVGVVLKDSPTKQLAQTLGGHPLPVELSFQPLNPTALRPRPAATATSGGHDVSWGAAIAALIVCAAIAFPSVVFLPGRVKGEAQ